LSRGFSALQRAENFSIEAASVLNSELTARFSALQRAENFSMSTATNGLSTPLLFQCSSASRKFLNAARAFAPSPSQRVSVLFSEPKISQL